MKSLRTIVDRYPQYQDNFILRTFYTILSEIFCGEGRVEAKLSLVSRFSQYAFNWGCFVIHLKQRAECKQMSKTQGDAFWPCV